MPFPENLMKLQSQNGESNYKLAKTLGVSQSTIANWRNGSTKPLDVYVEKIAAHYGTTADELMKEGEHQNAESET